MPAGNYVATAHIEILSIGQEGAVGVRCHLGSDSGGAFHPDYDDWFGENTTLTSVIAHPGGTIDLTCTSTGGDVAIRAVMTGIRVDATG